MIRLTCTQCKSVLEMDDAFAGGVCRCQYCGTIQTVPSHLKGSAESAVSTGTGAKSLYQGAGTSSGPGTRSNTTGLYDLADAVTGSSGLSQGNIKNRVGTVYVPPETNKAAPPAPNRLPLLVGAGAVVAILLGVALWLIFGRSKSVETTPNSNPTPPPAAVEPPKAAPGGPSSPASPHFLSIPITQNKVVYLIDRSDSAKQTFDTVKAAMFNSIDSLTPNREFAVIFWGRPGEKDLKPWSYPEKGLAKATPQQAENCRTKFSDTQAVGATDVAAAIKQAYSLKPDMIFLVTAKGISLDDSFAHSMDAARKNSNAKIYAIDLANGEGRKFLEPIGNKTHGSYTSKSPFDVTPD